MAYLSSLGRWCGTERVLDGEFVQAELGREFVQQLLGRVEQVDPDQRVGILQVVGHLREREVLTVEHTFAPHPRHARCRHVTPAASTCTN